MVSPGVDYRNIQVPDPAPLPLRRCLWRGYGFSRSRLWRAPRAARGTHRRAKRNGATARQRRNGNQIMLLAFGAASSSPSTPPPPSPPPAIATAWLQANQGCRQTRRDPSISHAKVLQANQDCRQIRGAQGLQARSYSLPSLQRILQGVQGLPTRVRDGARTGKRRPVLQYNNICLKQDPSRSRYKNVGETQDPAPENVFSRSRFSRSGFWRKMMAPGPAEGGGARVRKGWWC